ncbi:pantoate--beta-alanine ligase PAN6 NDAI_0F00320 [Naumovozyma dairenensis CBS 421]|uniref:Pantoate--beta-alanine ligase n=1 Tax=Naumovozyma dairenensis (strain ATCC 10597 / BCRC 20456 / CBS 421 / NBRC 0211 / NRRL Y-12639) TaxID=1071378 RepID=G0WC40_NAUDC|nr:hypothetical protein NDAI_0F00320 [Naumovozyma dairenensis CBS 421]CCD25351.1 hypothetical protein NDAI_0F00320 [Naumovozyma dairenensis CBS 421]
MKILHTVEEVREWRNNVITNGGGGGSSVGFVATMGCLHEGHKSLISQSLKDNEFTVVSIFVNPSQFAPTEDLDKYPRTMDEDITMLVSLGVNILFAPNAHVMYPQGIPLNVEEQRGPFVTVLGLSEMLEGKTRPNFFRGVATVVMKLLNIVSPNVAYFGQKDIQQFIVLDTMCKELFVNTKLVMMPIIRDEKSGLALSSRNKYLCEESLKIASNIYRGLKEGQLHVGRSREDIMKSIEDVWQPFIDSGDFEVDYISIADFKTLKEVDTVPTRTTTTQTPNVVLSCAIYLKDRANSNTVVRLIDNILI